MMAMKRTMKRKVKPNQSIHHTTKRCDFRTFIVMEIMNLRVTIGSFEEHYGSKKGGHHKKGHKKG